MLIFCLKNTKNYKLSFNRLFLNFYPHHIISFHILDPPMRSPLRGAPEGGARSTSYPPPSYALIIDKVKIVRACNLRIAVVSYLYVLCILYSIKLIENI